MKDLATCQTFHYGTSEHGFYSIRTPLPNSFVAYLAERISLDTWHLCLGHPHNQIVRAIIKKNSLPDCSSQKQSICSFGQLGKLSKVSLSVNPSSNSSPLDLIFNDVWSPSPTMSSDGHCYFEIFC